MEGNLIPIYALFYALHAYVEGCTVAGSFLALLAQWRWVSYELLPQMCTKIPVTNHGKIVGKCFSLTHYMWKVLHGLDSLPFEAVTSYLPSERW